MLNANILALAAVNNYGDGTSGVPITMDFAGNTATRNGVSTTIAALTSSFTRTAGGAEPWQRNAAGIYTQVSAGVRRQSDLGTIIEGARTNPVRNNRDLTQATWTKTNCTPLLNQTGIDGISNSASSLTSLAINATCLTTFTGAGNRTASAFVKRLIGTGTVEMTMDNGVTWTAVTVTAGWTRVRIPTQSITNSSIGFRIAILGDSIGVDFVQGENGAVGLSSPILTGAAAATRNAENFGLLTSLFNLNIGTLKVAFNNPQADTAVAMLVCMRTTAPAVVIEQFSPGSVIRGATVSGINLDGSTPIVPLSGASYKAAFAWSSGDSAAAYSANLGGNTVTDSTSFAMTGPLTSVGVQNNNGGQQGYCYLSYLEYTPVRLSNAAIAAWALS